MRSDHIKFHLYDVKLLGTGMDDGHTYIKGKTEFPPHGIVTAWAYFDFEDRAKEEDFERCYSGGDVEIESSSWDYFPSTGLSLHDVTWRNATEDATSNA